MVGIQVQAEKLTHALVGHRQTANENQKSIKMPGIASINAETTRIEPLLASSSSHDEESDASSEVDAAALVENDDLYDSDIEGPRGHRAIVEVQSVLDEWPQLLERYTLLKKVGEGVYLIACVMHRDVQLNGIC